ncbi:MAG: GNAT family N-acetyltransferase [Bdellovibrionota bacterium]
MRVLDWDSRVLGLSVGRIEDIADAAGVSHSYEYSGLTAHMKSMGLEYVTVRRPIGEWSRLRGLESAGFRIVDGILSFTKSLEGTAHESKARLSRPTDVDAVAALAISTFSKSRFHNDGVIAKEAADRLHGEWARNSCAGIVAKAVLVVDDGANLGGFITCKVSRTNGSIDLIGVAPSSAGKGIGRSLVASACDWFAKAGCKEVQVQTQIDNHAAIRLYFGAGFTPNASYVTLRWTTRQEISR